MDGLQQFDESISTTTGSGAAIGGNVAGQLAAFDHSPRTAWSTGAAALFLFCITVLLLTGAFGCTDRPSLIPNSDASLRKTMTEFAQDAATRQPYHAEAPHPGKLNGRAVFDYQSNTLQVANFTPEDWTDVELWVNQRYVVFLPRIEGKASIAKTINFEMLYDERARSFPTDNVDSDSMVRKVEIFRDGKMYELATAPAD